MNNDTADHRYNVCRRENRAPEVRLCFDNGVLAQCLNPNGDVKRTEKTFERLQSGEWPAMFEALHSMAGEPGPVPQATANASSKDVSKPEVAPPPEAREVDIAVKDLCKPKIGPAPTMDKQNAVVAHASKSDESQAQSILSKYPALKKILWGLGLSSRV